MLLSYHQPPVNVTLACRQIRKSIRARPVKLGPAFKHAGVAQARYGPPFMSGTKTRAELGPPLCAGTSRSFCHHDTTRFNCQPIDSFRYYGGCDRPSLSSQKHLFLTQIVKSLMANAARMKPASFALALPAPPSSNSPSANLKSRLISTACKLPPPSDNSKHGHTLPLPVPARQHTKKTSAPHTLCYLFHHFPFLTFYPSP